MNTAFEVSEWRTDKDVNKTIMKRLSIIYDIFLNKFQQTFTCPKLIIETHKKGVKSVQGKQ